VLAVTRGGYYAWKRSGPSRRALEDERLRGLIGKVFRESLETYGAPRIHAELADDYGIRIGQKRVARLMKGLGIEGASRRGKRRYRTTIPAKEQPTAPDLVRRSSNRPRPTGSGSPTSPTSRPGRVTSCSPA
jgi:putative transposase